MKRETVYRIAILFLFAFVVGAFAAVCYVPLEPYDRDREKLIDLESRAALP